MLSVSLDRIPFLPDGLSADVMPRMRLSPDMPTDDSPEGFLERTLEARLASFWRNLVPKQSAQYSEMVAEERFNKFCDEYLVTLPPAFALEPHKEWDERIPALPSQRQLLHIAIYLSVLFDFRAILMWEPDQVHSIPSYRRVLLSSQLNLLASVALRVLECVSALHAMMAFSQTRFPGIISPSLEAALVLVCLCVRPDFLADERHGEPHAAVGANPIGVTTDTLTRDKCMQASREALNLLNMLADVSDMAEVGARNLESLIARATEKMDKLKPEPPQSTLEELVDDWDWEAFSQDLGLNFSLDSETSQALYLLQ